MQFLIIGDLHGNKPNIYYKGFDAIIAPGDFCSDAARKYMFQALREKLKNPKSKKKWYDLISRIEARKMIKKSLSDGRIILEYLNSFNVPVYVVPGNWDWTKDKEAEWNYLKQDHYKKLIGGLNNIIDIHHKIIDAGNYQFIGHGISSGPEYPQLDLKRFTQKELVKKKKNYDKLLKKYNKLFMKAVKPVIFLSHNVPFNTSIDEITNKESPRCGYHYGSLIAREMIDKHQPLVCVGGHMHEHFDKCKIGKTTCINAGYGSNVNVWMELEGDKIKKLEFHKE